MDFLLEQNNLLILAVAAISGTMILFGNLRKGGSNVSVSVQEAVRLSNQQQGIFVDIRSSDSFKKGAIAQSRNIPRDEIETKSSSLPKDKPIIIVCDTGQSATPIVNKLRKLGFENTVNMQGGIRGWSQDGLPLTKKG